MHTLPALPSSALPPSAPPPSPPSAPKPARRLAFALLALAIYAVGWLAVQVHLNQGAAVPEWPMAIDFLIVIPLLGLWLLRPHGAARWLLVAGSWSLGIWLGAKVLPLADQHLWLLLAPLRYAILAALLGAQLWLIAQAFGQVFKASPHEPLEHAVHRAVAQHLGPSAGQWLGLLQLDARVWLYALYPKRQRLAFSPRSPRAGVPQFYGIKQGGNASNQQAFLILLGLELPIAHALLHVLVSPSAAVIVTALSVYGWLFMWADYRATLLRPTTLEGDALHLRMGCLWDVRLPLAAITAAVPAKQGKRARAKDRLRLIGMGQASCTLQLAPGTRLQLPWGERAVSEIDLAVDEAARFIAAVNAGQQASLSA